MANSKMLYVLLGPPESGQAKVAKRYISDRRQVLWHANQHEHGHESLLSRRLSSLRRLVAGKDLVQVWADDWMTELDKHFCSWGVYDYEGLESLLVALKAAADNGLLVKFVYVKAGPLTTASREASDSSASPYFALCKQVAQKRDDLASLSAIDACLGGLLELLPNSTLEAVETE